MASVINTNTLSMVTQQNLNQSQNALNTSMERLSSGLRINSAKDDAAGQAIANRMDAQITGLSQAQRNANDGISVAQTAEGALNQVNDNLQRVRELTVQAQSGTNNADDLSSIQDEITMRLDEINRISEQTSFNGINVLESDQTLSIQVGANDNENIKIDLAKVNSSTLGLNTFSVSGDQVATADDLINDFDATGNSTYNADIDGSAATDIKVDISSGKVTNNAGTDLYVSQTTGKLTEAGTNKALSSAADSAEAIDFATKFAGTDKGDVKSIGGVEWTRESTGVDANGNGTYSATVDGKEIEITISESADTSGSSAELKVSKGTLVIDSSTTSDSTASGNFVAGTSKFTTYSTNENATETDVKSAGGSYTGAALTVDSKTFTADASGTVKASGAITAGDQVGVMVDGDAVYIQNSGETNQKLISQTDAQEASRDPLEKLDAALKQVDNMRSDLGAVQNRFDSAITNLATTETNLASAQSRIQDADYAEEVSSMTTAQILQQAGTSMLTQANQVPQNVLSLLG